MAHPSAHIDVDFEHWRCELPEEWLIRYGSPHFEPSRAGRELCERVQGAATRCHADTGMSFDRVQILAANEAFPEAAVADPLADLEIWDEWSSGTRTFPYPGRYSQLGLAAQEGKTSASSSVGVVGEIMAGLFAQVGIAPWVLVRVVRRWPDFIFSTADGCYAFVEAKAFTTEPQSRHPLVSRTHTGLLGEAAWQAVQQINADPFVKVWGAFTYIRAISPMRFGVTFVEFDGGDARRQRAVRRMMPQAVAAGLASRALSQAAAKLPADRHWPLQARARRKSPDRQRTEAELNDLAKRELESLLVEAGAASLDGSRKDLDDELRKQVTEAAYPEREEGKMFFAARERATRGEFAYVRTVGRHVLMMADMSPEERHALERTWSPEWTSAPRPVSSRGRPCWRCGGAVYTLEER